MIILIDPFPPNLSPWTHTRPRPQLLSHLKVFAHALLCLACLLPIDPYIKHSVKGYVLL